LSTEVKTFTIKRFSAKLCLLKYLSMRYLVTGGAGFIVPTWSKQLLDEGHEAIGSTIMPRVKSRTAL